MRVLLAMLTAWKREGHKALVFTQTVESLNLIAAAIVAVRAAAPPAGVGQEQQRHQHEDQQGIQWLRLDGTTPICKRHKIINAFQTDPVRGALQFPPPLCSTAVSPLFCFCFGQTPFPPPFSPAPASLSLPPPRPFASIIHHFASALLPCLCLSRVLSLIFALYVCL